MPASAKINASPDDFFFDATDEQSMEMGIQGIQHEVGKFWGNSEHMRELGTHGTHTGHMREF